jgi:hypothetical protein
VFTETPWGKVAPPRRSATIVRYTCSQGWAWWPLSVSGERRPIPRQRRPPRARLLSPQAAQCRDPPTKCSLPELIRAPLPRFRTTLNRAVVAVVCRKNLKALPRCRLAATPSRARDILCAGGRVRVLTPSAWARVHVTSGHPPGLFFVSRCPTRPATTTTAHVSELDSGQVMDVLPCAYLQAGNAMFSRRREHLFFRRTLLPRLANTIRTQLPSPEFPGHTESNNMPNQSHTKAAEHHESAAKSHRAAAEQHGKNDHGKAKEHATQAQQHSKTAREHSEQANTKSHAQK